MAASISVSPAKIALGGSGTATITLTRVATADVGGRIADDYQNSPAVATMPQSVVVPAGSRAATFAIRGGDYPGHTFLVAVTTDQS